MYLCSYANRYRNANGSSSRSNDTGFFGDGLFGDNFFLRRGETDFSGDEGTVFALPFAVTLLEPVAFFKPFVLLDGLGVLMSSSSLSITMQEDSSASPLREEPPESFLFLFAGATDARFFFGTISSTTLLTSLSSSISCVTVGLLPLLSSSLLSLSSLLMSTSLSSSTYFTLAAFAALRRGVRLRATGVSTLLSLIFLFLVALALRLFFEEIGTNSSSLPFFISMSSSSSCSSSLSLPRDSTTLLSSPSCVCLREVVGAVTDLNFLFAAAPALVLASFLPPPSTVRSDPP
mmetsp:Transcript_8990/g.15304  ORF Transcript_8990/g.15304 Transcript_8990/m.15304 type:complete len:290 (-) Transcript_8990:586-1455(-)